MLYLIIYLAIGLIDLVVSFIFLSMDEKAKGKTMKWSSFTLVYSVKLLVWPIDISCMIWAATYLIKANEQEIKNYEKLTDWAYED